MYYQCNLQKRNDNNQEDKQISTHSQPYPMMHFTHSLIYCWHALSLLGSTAKSFLIPT